MWEAKAAGRSAEEWTYQFAREDWDKLYDWDNCNDDIEQAKKDLWAALGTLSVASGTENVAAVTAQVESLAALIQNRREQAKALYPDLQPLGDGTAIDEQLWQEFQASGVLTMLKGVKAYIPAAYEALAVIGRFAPSGQVLPSDQFWDTLGTAVASDATGRKIFTAIFLEWADRFNAKVAEHWRAYPNDYAGHTDFDELIRVYSLTPEKVEELWAHARSSHVDPRLLLAILWQEGTGSFDTNAENRAHYDNGHGPQPNWTLDLQCAVDGPIFSKLRLYPYAVKGGFTGTWIQYCNWFTPMDTASKRGAPGVFAEDINWGSKVEGYYRDVAAALGSTQDDPIRAHSDWMGQNGDLFTPRYVTGDFVIKMGLPPGTDRPNLAVWHTLPKPPYPGTEMRGSWWWFPAPDEFCWHVEYL